MGIGTDQVDAGAILEIDSPNETVLFPRFAESDFTDTPVEGMSFYDTNVHCLKVYQGGVKGWNCLPLAGVTLPDCIDPTSPEFITGSAGGTITANDSDYVDLKLKQNDGNNYTDAPGDATYAIVYEILDNGGNVVTGGDPYLEDTGTNHYSFKSVSATGTYKVRATVTYKGNGSCTPTSQTATTGNIVVTAAAVACVDPTSPEFITGSAGGTITANDSDYVDLKLKQNDGNNYTDAPGDATYAIVYEILDNGGNVVTGGDPYLEDTGTNHYSFKSVSATGTYKVRATVTYKGDGSCTPTSQTVTTGNIVVNTATACNAPDFDITEGNTHYIYTGTTQNLNITDNDTSTGNTYAWAIITTPAGSSPTLSPSTGASSAFSTPVDAANVGTYVVRVTATNNCDGTTTTQDITILTSVQNGTINTNRALWFAQGSLSTDVLMYLTGFTPDNYSFNTPYGVISFTPADFSYNGATDTYTAGTVTCCVGNTGNVMFDISFVDPLDGVTRYFTYKPPFTIPGSGYRYFLDELPSATPGDTSSSYTFTD